MAGVSFRFYSEMVPVWQMATSKRVGFANSRQVSAGGSGFGKVSLRHLMRFRHPVPFLLDYIGRNGRRNFGRVIRQDEKEPEVYRPLGGDWGTPRA